MPVDKQRVKALNAKLKKVLKTKARYRTLYGGRGCVHADTLIDTPQGQVKISDFNGGEICCYDGSKIITSFACKPIRYNKEKLYKVSTSNGFSIVCTDQHRFLTSDGWVMTKDLDPSAIIPIYSGQHQIWPAYLPPSTSGACPLEYHEDALHCFRTFLGLIYHYWQDYRPCDAQPQLELNTYLDIVRKLADGRQHNYHASTHTDGQGSENNNNLLQSLFHLSSRAFLLLEEVQNYVMSENCIDGKASVLLLESFRSARLSREKKDHQGLMQALCEHVLCFYNLQSQDENLKKVAGILECGVGDSSLSDPYCCNVNLHYITGIEYHSTDYYYDMFVPFHNNYLSNGIINHNSGKSHAVGEFAVMAMASCTMRVVCCRQFLNKSGESIFKLLKNKVDKFGLQDQFKDQALGLKCSTTGSEAMFYGLWRNIDEIKSLEDIDVCILEEAHNLTEQQFTILNGTFRKPGFCFIVVFNPRLCTDFAWKKFVVEDMPNAVKVKLNYYDNPYLDEDYIRDVIDYMKATDEQAYIHHYLGEPLSDDDDSIIKRSWVLAAIDAHLKLGIEPTGSSRIGYDVADSGNDWCATIAAKGSLAFGLDMWKAKEDELLKSCTRAWTTARDHKAHIYYDAIGVGAHSGAKFNELNQVNNARVPHTKFFAGGQANKPDSNYALTGIKNKDYFSNIKAQQWALVADRFRNTFNAVTNGQKFADHDMIFIDSEMPHIEQLIDELCIVKRDFDLSGRFKAESKKDLIKRDVASPNCFVAGTLVKTNKGQLPIESLKIGDMVLTPMGYSKITHLHQGESIVITKLGLTGTPDHEVFTWNKGWVSLQMLSLCDSIEFLEIGILKWQIMNRLYTKAKCSQFSARVDIIVRDGMATSMMAMRDYYTEGYGLSIMAKFLQNITSTILMAIGATTELKTLIALRARRTNLCTCLKDLKAILTGMKINRFWIEQERRPQNGTSQIAEGRGIANTQDNNLARESLRNILALFADRLSYQEKPINPMLARQNVQQREQMTWLQSNINQVAGNVDKNLSTLNCQEGMNIKGAQKDVPVQSKEKVYNITLAEHNVYYANGILVKNCGDAFIMAFCNVSSGGLF